MSEDVYLLEEVTKFMYNFEPYTARINFYVDVVIDNDDKLHIIFGNVDKHYLNYLKILNEYLSNALYTQLLILETVDNYNNKDILQYYTSAFDSLVETLQKFLLSDLSIKEVASLLYMYYIIALITLLYGDKIGAEDIDIYKNIEFNVAHNYIEAIIKII